MGPKLKVRSSDLEPLFIEVKDPYLQPRRRRKIIQKLLPIAQSTELIRPFSELGGFSTFALILTNDDLHEWEDIRLILSFVRDYALRDDLDVWTKRVSISTSGLMFSILLKFHEFEEKKYDIPAMKPFVDTFDALFGMIEFQRQMVDQFDQIEVFWNRSFSCYARMEEAKDVSAWKWIFMFADFAMIHGVKMSEREKMISKVTTKIKENMMSFSNILTTLVIFSQYFGYLASQRPMDEIMSLMELEERTHLIRECSYLLKTWRTSKFLLPESSRDVVQHISFRILELFSAFVEIQVDLDLIKSSSVSEEEEEKDDEERRGEEQSDDLGHKNEAAKNAEEDDDEDDDNYKNDDKDDDKDVDKDDIRRKEKGEISETKIREKEEEDGETQERGETKTSPKEKKMIQAWWNDVACVHPRDSLLFQSRAMSLQIFRLYSLLPPETKDWKIILSKSLSSAAIGFIPPTEMGVVEESLARIEQHEHQWLVKHCFSIVDDVMLNQKGAKESQLDFVLKWALHHTDSIFPGLLDPFNRSLTGRFLLVSTTFGKYIVRFMNKDKHVSHLQSSKSAIFQFLISETEFIEKNPSVFQLMGILFRIIANIILSKSYRVEEIDLAKFVDAFIHIASATENEEIIVHLFAIMSTILIGETTRTSFSSKIVSNSQVDDILHIICNMLDGRSKSTLKISGVDAVAMELWQNLARSMISSAVAGRMTMSTMEFMRYLKCLQNVCKRCVPCRDELSYEADVIIATCSVLFFVSITRDVSIHAGMMDRVLEPLSMIVVDILEKMNWVFFEKSKLLLAITSYLWIMNDLGLTHLQSRLVSEEFLLSLSHVLGLMDEENLKMNGVPIAGLLLSIFKRLGSSVGKRGDSGADVEVDDESANERSALPAIWMTSRGQDVKDPELQKHVVVQIVKQIVRHESGFSVESISLLSSLFRMFLSNYDHLRGLAIPWLLDQLNRHRKCEAESSQGIAVDSASHEISQILSSHPRHIAGHLRTARDVVRSHLIAFRPGLMSGSTMVALKSSAMEEHSVECDANVVGRRKGRERRSGSMKISWSAGGEDLSGVDLFTGSAMVAEWERAFENITIPSDEEIEDEIAREMDPFD